MPPPEERSLIDGARRGDGAAFGELVRRYDRQVLRLALRLVRSEEEARDIYQESFLRAFRALPGFRFECSFGTWLYRIVSGVALDHLRRASARGGVTVAWSAAGHDTDGGRGPVPAEPVEERPGLDPERSALGREIGGRVDRALAGLPARERMVFELRHEEGMSALEIATILETTPETVRNCLYRAHGRLRSALADLAPGGPGSRAAAAAGSGDAASGRPGSRPAGAGEER